MVPWYHGNRLSRITVEKAPLTVHVPGSTSSFIDIPGLVLLQIQLLTSALQPTSASILPNGALGRGAPKQRRGCADGDSGRLFVPGHLGAPSGLPCKLYSVRPGRGLRNPNFLFRVLCEKLVPDKLRSSRETFEKLEDPPEVRGEVQKPLRIGPNPCQRAILGPKIPRESRLEVHVVIIVNLFCGDLVGDRRGPVFFCSQAHAPALDFP